MSALASRKTNLGPVASHLLESFSPAQQQIDPLRKALIGIAWVGAAFKALLVGGGHLSMDRRLTYQELPNSPFWVILYQSALSLGPCAGLACATFQVASYIIQTNLYPEKEYQKELLTLGPSEPPSCFCSKERLISLFASSLLVLFSKAVKEGNKAVTAENRLVIELFDYGSLLICAFFWIVLAKEPSYKKSGEIEQRVRYRFLEQFRTRKEWFLSMELQNKGVAFSESPSREFLGRFQEIRSKKDAESFTHLLRFFLQGRTSNLEPLIRRWGRCLAKALGWICALGNILGLYAIFQCNLENVVALRMPVTDKKSIELAAAFAICLCAYSFSESFWLIPEMAESLFAKTYDTLCLDKAKPTLANCLRPRMDRICTILSFLCCFCSYGPGKSLAQRYVPDIYGSSANQAVAWSLIGTSTLLSFTALRETVQKALTLWIAYQNREEERTLLSLIDTMDTWISFLEECSSKDIAEAFLDIRKEERLTIISSLLPDEQEQRLLLGYLDRKPTKDTHAV